MATEADGDVDLLVQELPLDMEDGRRLAYLLPPLHIHTGAGEGDAPQPFRLPPPLQAATSAEPRLSFRGWLGAPRHWDLWVAKLRPIHADLWRRLGIHDAVLSSTCRFRRDASALLHLASFWCPRTNTFAFPWGEATVTLHDITLLAGFPAYGAPLPAPLAPEWAPDEAALNGVRLGFNRSACKKAHHSAWVKHFLTDDGDQEHEHAAFLALWLTRFVLPGHPESTMRQCLFPIAVRLAGGERIALGPAVLASLYRDLRDIKAFLLTTAAAAGSNADMLSSLSLYAPLYILQLWMWEHFPVLRPGRENPLMDGDPMAARWHDLSRKINPTLIREALGSADSFLWQPYPSSMYTTGWVHSSNLLGNDDLTTLAHCLRPCELVGMDCIEQYLPHRVARQFGLDQDVPGDVPRANQNWAVAWQTYQLVGKNVAFIIPQAKPGVTSRYAHWWRQQLPRHDLDDVGASSIPVQLKTSKRKVKKTLVALEAEEEKRRLKKAHVSPVTSDKKRKLEELYDPKLPDWLTAARNEVNDTAGGNFQWGSSLPKYDTTLDEALLPNVGAANDDAVLLLPRKQTTSPVVMSMNDHSINPAIGDRGTFKAEIPIDVPSPDVTGSPEEGTIVLMEASGASDIPEEVTAPATEEKEEKNIIEGTSCVAVTNRSVKNLAVLMEMDEGNAVSEEVGRSAKESNEGATQSQQEVDTSSTNCLHVAVALPEEALPIQHTNNGGGCSKVSCTIEGNNVAVGLITDAGEIACHDFVVEEQSEVPSVEVIGGGDDHQIVEKDNEEKAQDVEHKELSEIDHTELAEPKMHSRTDIEKLEEADAVECAKIYGTVGLTGRDTVGEKHGFVPEVGNDKMEKNRGLVFGIRDKKVAEISEVEHAKMEAVKCMMEEDTDSKSEDVPVLEIAGSGETYGTIEEDTDDRLSDVHDVNAEVEQSVGHEMHSDGPEGVLQEDLQTRDDIPREVYSKEKLLADGNLRDEPQREQDTKEKPLPNGEFLPEKHVDVSKGEVYENINYALGVEKADRQDKELTEKDIHEHIEEITLVVQVEGQKESLTTVSTEQITQVQEKEFDKDFVDDSKNSTDDEVEPSSDTAALMVGGVHEHKTLDTHEAATLKQELDNKIICDYREKTTLEGSHMMDTGVRPALVTMEVDETHAAVVIRDQKISDMDKQLALEERQDIGIVMDMSKATDIIVCDEQQINQIEVNEFESTIGIQNQELIDNVEQLAMGERQDLVGTITEKNKLNTLDVADILVCGEHHIDPTDTKVNEVKSTKATQNKEPMNNKKQLAIEERQDVGTRTENKKFNISEHADILSGTEYQINPSGMAIDEVKSTHRADRSGTSLEEAYNAADHELLSTADMQHDGVKKVSEKRILEDASMAGSGNLYSDAIDLDVNMSDSREGTLNQCALGAKKGAVAPEEKDHGTADENTKRDLVDIDALECGGVKPDEAGEVEGSESNQALMKELQEPLPPDPKNPAEAKQEKLENETVMSICRDNDEESEKDHTAAEVTITRNLDRQGENGNGLAEESTKSYENLASNPKGTACLLKLGKSSIEEVKRTYNTRSMYLKDIKESLGRIRAEPLNRVQTAGVGNYSRHAVQEPISVCKEIKVPFRDSSRDFGRERASELVLASPPEETSRWRQEQYALQILEDVQNSRIAEKTRMEMEIRVLKAQIASMERQVMNMDHFAEVKSRSKRH
ncbi:hypothetical protein PR202_ga10786 [Eleusine coracana subsp. coracana]|uniref:Aminotransferase-like plant mobile domain-containing protein n=1 Tax=Eleusine coracana subsp. coracana TaxID=191504 RepID=A0AAV5C7L9_ELECO|nr:hypothetical protein PR202_ga10786 [Eleusine coracana subsp. coracana]